LKEKNKQYAHLANQQAVLLYFEQTINKKLNANYQIIKTE